MFQAHRERYLTQLAREDTAAIVPTGGLKIRNHDSEYRSVPGATSTISPGSASPTRCSCSSPGTARRAASSS